MIEKKRPWFQFHLSTALVAMIVAGGLVGVICWRVHAAQIAGRTLELKRMEFADPVADANSAIANKDYRFVGICGYAIDVPGVDSDLQSRCGVLPISGTSCCIMSKEEWRLTEIAYKYADKYNLTIMAAIPIKK